MYSLFSAATPKPTLKSPPSPSSSSPCPTLAIHASFTRLNHYLLHHRPYSSSRCRRCLRLRQYSHRNDDNCKHHTHTRRDKAEAIHDDDDESPTTIHSSLAEPPDDPPLRLVQQGEQNSLLQFLNSPILSASFVGLFTGLSIVLFNYTVHEIRDLCWDGLPYRGASWLREQPIEAKWRLVILVPAFGGLIVTFLNMIRTALQDSITGTWKSSIKSALKSFLKTVAACVTLGTGNSLGPEGPSVEIGVSVAKGVGSLLDERAERKLSLRASGSAAGIASGFNAAVAGCFFAVESVLWPSPVESSLSLTNTTSMVILSAVIASVVSEIGLGSQPAFAVPVYDFRSPSELPLYLLLGVLCGLVSVGFAKSTSFMLVFFDSVQRTVGIPKAAFPVLGGLTVGLMALSYPEILYWGFENVDTLLESRPWSNSLSAYLLLQIVAVKILATSICRASGLVGGYYAPSLFIGAGTGMAYGKILGYLISESNPLFQLSVLEVASPQAYGLVGMAATLAGVCQVPLTSVLLLFELTQDYRIVLPLLGAVGLSSLITSDKTRKSTIDNTSETKEENYVATSTERYSGFNSTPNVMEPIGASICEHESSLCLIEDSDDDTDYLTDEILVSQVMRTKYVTTVMSSSLTDVVSLMLEEKQSCALIIDDNDQFIGQLTLTHIHQFIELSIAEGRKSQVIRVSELCSYGERCLISWKVTPNMNLGSALTLMDRLGVSQLPVILEDGDHGGCPVGLLEREVIDLAYRAFAVQRGLSWLYLQEQKTSKN